MLVDNTCGHPLEHSGLNTLAQIPRNTPQRVSPEMFFGGFVQEWTALGNYLYLLRLFWVDLNGDGGAEVEVGQTRRFCVQWV